MSARFHKRSLLARVAAAALVLSIAGAASAGEKEEARRHFKAGMKAIENGDYDKGIAELKVAYDTLPHPNVLYNIARAYAESGDLESAIAYYRKYLAENPPDKDEIVDVYASYALNQSKLDAPDGCTAFAGDKRTSQHKIIAGAQLRTKAGFDAGLDFFYYSGQTWAEQRINYDTGNIEYVPFDLAGYAVLNGRIGYRFKGEPLDLAVGGTNLLNDVHREHPFGQLIGRKIYVSLGYRF